MRILPSELRPPKKKLDRSHSNTKPSRDPRSFLSCLRCEFGFTCPYCLLHEADFSPGIGAVGTGQFSIEHRVPRSEDPDQVGRYGNCLYACSRCNRARSNRPIINAQGFALLHPAEAIWFNHFEVINNEVVPLPDDEDARYTHDAYDINAPDKVARREFRKVLIEDLRPLCEEGSNDDLEGRLLTRAEEVRTEDRALFYDLVSAAEEYRRTRRRALRELEWYRAMPSDAPTSCRCKIACNDLLPDGIFDQIWHLDPEL